MLKVTDPHFPHWFTANPLHKAAKNLVCNSQYIPWTQLVCIIQPNPMVGGMVQNSMNQNHHQHQQPICSSTFFFYINNKIRPTSTINIIINHRNMPNSTTRENQHQQKFLFSSTTICFTTNIGHRLQQQNTFNNLGTNDWLWSREVGTQKF